MLKNISNLGSVLNKSEQKTINGGANGDDSPYYDCYYVPINSSCKRGYVRKHGGGDLCCKTREPQEEDHVPF